jgi:hypothetical protein
VDIVKEISDVALSYAGYLGRFGFGGLLFARHLRPGLLHSEVRDRLWLLVVEELKVISLERSQSMALRIPDDYPYENNIHVNFKGRHLVAGADLRGVPSFLLLRPRCNLPQGRAGQRQGNYG